MESKRICGEIKIGTVMEPVRFGSWDLGRMGVWRGKANCIQMTGRILSNRRLDLFPLRVSFANSLFCSLLFAQDFSTIWTKQGDLVCTGKKNKKQGTSSCSISKQMLSFTGNAQNKFSPPAGLEVRNVLYMFRCFRSF